MAQLERAITNGEFDLGYYVVSPITREAELLKACPEAEPSVLNGPHRSFRLPVATIAQREFITFVCFSNDKISKPRLSHNRGRVLTWADYSEAGERAEQQENTLWIASNLGVGSPHSFSWGTIHSVFDQTSPGAYMWVNYSQDLLIHANGIENRMAGIFRRIWGLRAWLSPSKRSP
jgi:hypothetical protein